MKNLVIVESPTKAKTISKFLGNDFIVESSFGHVRDLPKSKMGVDIEHDFAPEYIIPAKAKKTAAKLKKLAEKANHIYYATDEDREGEAISWHLAQILKTPENKIERIAFHEITEEAIKEALKNPRRLDLHLVDAQQARRILDRLVGYELSPFLWKKVARGLSAGRVQSASVRLIVEREREIQAFKTQEYWTIEGKFFPNDQPQQIFKAGLKIIDGKTLDKFAITNQAQAEEILNQSISQKYFVQNVEGKETLKSPPPPFTTSTLQQAANNHLGFSAKQTMVLAQQLYEGINIGAGGAVGLITYMRTDSLNLAEKFLKEAKEYIQSNFGEQYSLAKPRLFTKKQKLAQEAHEAIRPTNANLNPEEIKKYLDANQFKLYDLIWRRTMACQMAQAVMINTVINLNSQDNKFIFRANGQIIKFDGWLKVAPSTTKEELLPALTVGQELTAQEIKPEQHFTQPPARYSDATLVKALEQHGIGRPSTYAPTISTIIERGYVLREEKRLKPTDTAFLVNDLLVEHFPKIVDLEFTAQCENDFDEIAKGQKEWPPVIREFYIPFKDNLNKKTMELKKSDVVKEQTDEVCDKCGAPMIVKFGRFGKFIACSKFPECKNTKQLGKDGKAVAATPPEILEEKCPDCGAPLQKRIGRFGPFVGCSKYPECKFIKKNNGTGVKCPQCGQGEIVAKRARGRVFYACNKYPDCKFALAGKPTGDKCPDCQGLLITDREGGTICSNKDCGYQK